MIRWLAGVCEVSCGHHHILAIITQSHVSFQLARDGDHLGFAKWSENSRNFPVKTAKPTDIDYGDGYTLMHWAALRGRRDFVEFLVKTGGNSLDLKSAQMKMSPLRII